MLSSVVLPDGPLTIGAYAFGCCELTSVSLPPSLRFIDDIAFSDNDALTLIVPRGSYAHQYAERLGIPYQFAE